jgi:hypothetical protein
MKALLSFTLIVIFLFPVCAQDYNTKRGAIITNENDTTIQDENGKPIIGLLPNKATTTEPVVEFHLYGNTIVTMGKFKIWCTITDANDVVSKEGAAVK